MVLRPAGSGARAIAGGTATARTVRDLAHHIAHAAAGRFEKERIAHAMALASSALTGTARRSIISLGTTCQNRPIRVRHWGLADSRCGAFIGCPPGAHDDPEPLIARALSEPSANGLAAQAG